MARPGERRPRGDGEAGAPARDPDGERRAGQLLESFGPVELSCVDTINARLGSQADYLLRSAQDRDLDRHALCSFTAYALPQLRAFGWQVEIAPDYPFQVVDDDPPFYAQVDPEQGSRDWFSLELGIEVEGRRINLLPALLELLERLPPSARLDAAAPAGARLFALPVGERRYVTIPPERLQILLKVLRELYQPGDDHDRDTGRLRFPAVAAAAMAEMDAAFGCRPDGSARLRWAGEQAGPVKHRGQALLAGPPPGEMPPPRGLRADLRPYQREGLAWLQHLRALGAGGVLADDMGLGKTLQAIAHIVAEKDGGTVGPAGAGGGPHQPDGQLAPRAGPLRALPGGAGAARAGPASAVATNRPRRRGGHHLSGAGARPG